MGRHLAVKHVFIGHLVAIQQRTLVYDQINRTCTVGSQLAEDDILSDPCQRVILTEEGRVVENLRCFFERALSQRATIHTIDTMSSNRCEDTSLGHKVTECAQVAIVDVNVISAQNHSQFSDQTATSSLDTQSLQDLNDMVTCRSSGIDSFNGEHSCQIYTICLNQPASCDLRHSSCVWIINGPFTNSSTRGVEDLCDLFETSECDLVKNRVSLLSQQIDNCLAIFISTAMESASEYLTSCGCVWRVDQLHDWVIWIAIKSSCNAVYNISLELKVIVKHRLCWITLHFESEQPLANGLIIVLLKLFSFVPQLNEVLIFRDNCLGGIGVIVDAPFAD